MAEMPAFPVIVTHLEDAPGSGLAACSGRPFRTPRGFSNFARWLCTGCARYARPEPVGGLDVDRLATIVSDALAATTMGTDYAEAPEPSDEPGSPYVMRLTHEIAARLAGKPEPYVGPDVNILGIKESPGKGDIHVG